MNPTFAFITDFGRDFAVASMEALIIKELPNARIIHLDHSIEKFCISSAAFVLQTSYKYFPHGTVFIAIIDPGVGSNRQTLCIQTEHYTFIGPNNGIFHHILQQEKPVNIWHIDETIIQPASYTFHGRDLFTPAAIKYAQNDRSWLKRADQNDLVFLNEPERPRITYIDSFGNIKTNIVITDEISSSQHVSVVINDKSYDAKFVHTFSEAPVDDLIVYLGSNNTLEVAINLGSAQQKVNARAGQLIDIHPFNKHNS